MKAVTVHLPQATLDGVIHLVDSLQYPNKAEVIRQAIRDFLQRQNGGHLIAQQQED